MNWQCPSRAGTPVMPGIGDHDHWVENSWELSLDKAIKEKETLTGGGTQWRWPWMPDVCTFCSCIKIEHAVKLVEEGWEVEFTSKSYKLYLNPPGMAQRYRDLMEDINKPPTNNWWSPVPPIKLYTWHFKLYEDPDGEIEKFNMLIESLRGNW